MKKLLAIIPTYNEADNVRAIIQEVFAVAKTVGGWSFEVLVVDDNSPDGTAQIVQAMQAKNNNLHLITGQKVGLGEAYLRGFAYGLKKKTYDVILMMDADFSHDPKVIPELLRKIEAGSDYVIGSRYVSGAVLSGDWSFTRNQMSRLANLFARLLVGTKDVTDFTAGFKAIRSSALRQLDLTNIRASGYVFQVNLLHEFSRHGFKISEVPITFNNRRSGTSKMRGRDVIEFLYLTYQLNPHSRIRNLVRFIVIGASGTVVNLVVIWLLVQFWHWPVLLAGACAIEISIVSNFALNHTYGSKKAWLAADSASQDVFSSLILKLIRFNGIMLAGGTISFVVFGVGYRLLGIPYIPADLIGIIIAMGWNYWLNVRVVWSIVDA